MTACRLAGHALILISYRQTVRMRTVLRLKSGFIVPENPAHGQLLRAPRTARMLMTIAAPSGPQFCNSWVTLDGEGAAFQLVHGKSVNEHCPVGMFGPAKQAWSYGRSASNTCLTRPETGPPAPCHNS
jgi:hypothetical protein